MFPAKTETRVSKRASTAAAVVGNNTEEKAVVVAVKAEKMISRAALAWALTHVIRPGDCITLLAVFPAKKTGRRFWNFPRLTGDCGSRVGEKLPERIGQISESCSQMVLQFKNQIEVKVRIKVVSGTPGRAVAAEAMNNAANWVILDKKLKQELKHCIEELRCNIVVMKGSQAKVLRLNLGCSNEVQTPYYSAASSPADIMVKFQGQRMKHSTPVSSPEEPCTSYSRDSFSTSDTLTSLFLVYEQNPLFEGLNKGNHSPLGNRSSFSSQLMALGSHGEKIISLSTKQTSPAATNQKNVFWIPQHHIADEKSLRLKKFGNIQGSRPPISSSVRDSFVQYDQDKRLNRLELKKSHQEKYIDNSSIRDAVSLGRTSSIPPPLCSICQHKVPVFGKPPRRFSYEELEAATDGFSDMNFLAEGGFGVVYRGILRDGQVVAVKLLKFGGSEADEDFSREVRVLSCAQHRNVVLLIGFCIDGKKRVLVYEYICNRSLDFHLHENKTNPLDWHSRLKIAIGTARGLRYLHEDCRVGCIVHRDMRPNNILLTHDFEPLVSDFGLARWQSDWNINKEEQRVMGTLGYLAPEYVDGGKITEKIDIYAFGLVLLELMTGRRMRELQYFQGQHFVSDWFHPLAALEPNHILANIFQLLDPCLASTQVHDLAHESQAVARAASFCLLRDPESRPPMSKVLRVLEGGDTCVPLALDMNSVGNRSGHLRGLRSRNQPETKRTHSRKLSH